MATGIATAELFDKGPQAISTKDLFGSDQESWGVGDTLRTTAAVLGGFVAAVPAGVAGYARLLTAGPEEATKTIEDISALPNKLLKTDRQKQTAQNVSDKLTLIPRTVGKGYAGLTELISTGDLKKSTDVIEGRSAGSNILVPTADVFGQLAGGYAAGAGASKAVKGVKEATSLKGLKDVLEPTQEIRTARNTPEWIKGKVPETLKTADVVKDAITTDQREAILKGNEEAPKVEPTQPEIVQPGVTSEASIDDSAKVLSNVLDNQRGSVDVNGVTKFLTDIKNNIKDRFTIESIPKSARAGVGDSQAVHASARIAAPLITDDWLSKIFPTRYKDVPWMNNFRDLLNKDQILDGYDTFKEKAATARQAGDEAAAKGWDKKAQDIADAHDLSSYEKQLQDASKHPEIAETAKRMKEIVNPQLDQWFKEVKDIDPSTVDEGRGKYFGVRLNLVTKEQAEQIGKFMTDEKSPIPDSNYSNYKNPSAKHDSFDRAASFTGDYSDDMRAGLTAVVGERWNNVTKIRMYKDLIKKGVAVDRDSVTSKPETIQGKKVATFTGIEFPETNPETGVTRMVKKTLYIRDDVAPELRGVLNTDVRAHRIKALDALTALQLAQIADAVTHSKNLLAALSEAQGAKGGAVADILRIVPADSLARLVKMSNEVMQDTPNIRAEKAEMSKWGGIRPEFPATGIQKVTHAQQFIHHVDTGVRIALNRLFSEGVKQSKFADTLENRRNFVNKAGQYNRRLMGPIMRNFADLGISPFIVAGRNFNRLGYRMVTGNPGVKAASNLAAAQMRMVNLARTAITLGVAPVMLNMLTTGTPMGREGTPVGAWDIGTEEKEQGKHRVVDFAQITGLRRGMRGTGLNAAIEGLRQGHKADQISKAMSQDIIGTIMHPWLGPGPSAAAKVITGKQFDMRGRFEAQQFPGEYNKQVVENLRASLESQNPLLYSIIRPSLQSMGLDDKGYQNMGHAGNLIQKITGSNAMGEVADTLLKSPSSAFGTKDVFPPKTSAELKATDISGGNFPDKGPKNKADKEKTDLVDKYARAIENDKLVGKVADEFLKDVDEGKITQEIKDKINKRLETGGYLEAKVKGLSWKDALKVYIVATPEEQARLMDIMKTKGNGVSVEKFQDAMPLFEKAFAPEQPKKKWKEIGGNESQK